MATSNNYEEAQKLFADRYIRDDIERADAIYIHYTKEQAEELLQEKDENDKYGENDRIDAIYNSIIVDGYYYCDNLELAFSDEKIENNNLTWRYDVYYYFAQIVD